MSARLAFVLAAALAPGLALAQAAPEEEPAQNVRYQQQTELEFDIVKLTGEVVDDGFEMVIERRHAAFNPFITLRRDFTDQMTASVDEIR